ncbi:MAG TPA: RNA polymerase sigma factor [Lacunisphaera sp.]|jgi:RNA polymerase sigma-70 factor (ECF subfamily)
MEPLVFERVPSLPPSGVTAGLSATAMTAKPETIVAVFEAEESGLLRYAIGLVRRRTVAEEIVQETFLRLHQVWAEVDNPRAWLYRSVRNLALNHLRDQKPESELKEDTATADDHPPADVLGRNEAIGTMRLLLAEMSDEDRTLIRLKYNDDLKYQEISQRTGLSISNVGYRLHHVLKSLADALRHAGIEGSRG